MFIYFFLGSRVTTDQRVVAKQEIQEVEAAKRAGAPYAHHRYRARDTNTKLRPFFFYREFKIELRRK